MISSKSKQIIKISKNIMLSFEGFLNKMNVVYNETKKKEKVPFNEIIKTIKQSVKRFNFFLIRKINHKNILY